MVNKKSTWQERKLAKVRSAFVLALSLFLHWGVAPACPAPVWGIPLVWGLKSRPEEGRHSGEGAVPKGREFGKAADALLSRQRNGNTRAFQRPVLLRTLINNVFVLSYIYPPNNTYIYIYKSIYINGISYYLSTIRTTAGCYCCWPVVIIFLAKATSFFLMTMRQKSGREANGFGQDEWNGSIRKQRLWAF